MKQPNWPDFIKPGMWLTVNSDGKMMMWAVEPYNTDGMTWVCDFHQWYAEIPKEIYNIDSLQLEFDDCQQAKWQKPYAYRAVDVHEAIDLQKIGVQIYVVEGLTQEWMEHNSTSFNTRWRYAVKGNQSGVISEEPK